jgi:hypothetical protein
MTRPRALTSTFRYVIALFTALVVSVVGAAALPATAFAGQGQANGQANGQQATGADNPGKAHEKGQNGKAHEKGQNGKAHATSKGQSVEKSQERGSTKAPKTERAEKTQSTRGNSAQANQSKADQGAPAGKTAGTSGDKGDPQGNNGTIKLAGFEAPNGPGHASGDGSTPKHPSNDPHLACTFSVEGFGFDAVASESDLTFAQHAPTRGGTQHGTLPLDQDSHSGGGSTAGYDGVETFDFDWEGAPHPKHGYHIKLTAVTDYSQGSKTKHKVFWVEPCESTVTPPGEETPGEETPGEETPGEETPGEETPGEETPDEETPQEETPGGSNGVQQTADESGGGSSTVVFGAQASVQNSQGTQAAERSAAANTQVPTAVEAGLAGDEWSRSVLPLLAVLFGLGTTFVALARRRTRLQPVERD